MTLFLSIFFIFTVVISTAIFVIFLLSMHKVRNFGSTLSGFKRAVTDSGITIKRNERVGRRIIGVDAAKGKLLYFSAARMRRESHYIDLADIKSIEVNKQFGLTFSKHSRNKPAETDVTSITLQLTYKDGGQPLELPFYDKLDDRPSEIERRSRQAKEWRDILCQIVGGCKRIVPGPFATSQYRRLLN